MHAIGCDFPVMIQESRGVRPGYVRLPDTLKDLEFWEFPRQSIVFLSDVFDGENALSHSRARGRQLMDRLVEWGDWRARRRISKFPLHKVLSTYVRLCPGFGDIFQLLPKWER